MMLADGSEIHFSEAVSVASCLCYKLHFTLTDGRLVGLTISWSDCEKLYTLFSVVLKVVK